LTLSFAAHSKSAQVKTYHRELCERGGLQTMSHIVGSATKALTKL